MKRKTNDRHPPMPAAGRASARSADRSVSRVVPSGVSRGSFRVASALDVLGASVPEVYQAPAKRSAPVSVKRSVASAPPLSLSSPSPPSTGPARRAETLRPMQASKPASDRSPLRTTSVDLRPETNQSCKARPADSRKSGSGPSRDFIPWCSKRS